MKLDQQGQALILGVTLITALVVVSGLIIDTGYMFTQKGDLQGLAERSAISAIMQKDNGAPQVHNAAYQVIADNTDISNTRYTIEYPHNNNLARVKVTLSRPINFLFAQIAENPERRNKGSAVAEMLRDNTDWPQFQHNDQHTGYNFKASIAPPFTPAWEYKTNGVCRSQVVVHDGVAYIAGGVRLHAVDMKTGLAKWVFQTGGIDGCTPVIKNGTIYIGTNFGVAKVFALGLNGAVKWATTMKHVYTTAGLAVDDRYVYLQSSDDGRLYVLNASDGQPVIPAVIVPAPPAFSFLNRGLPGGGGTGGFSTPALWENKVYFCTGAGNIICYDTNTFTAVWSASLGWPAGILDSPTLANGRVYLGGSNMVYCLNANTGAVIWQSNVGMRCSTPAIAGSKVYVGSSNGLYCLNADTGAQIWHSGQNLYTTPAVAYGFVYSICGRIAKGLQVFDANTGALVWFSELSISPFFRDNGPTVAGGFVLLPGNNLNKTIAFKSSALERAHLIDETSQIAKEDLINKANAKRHQFWQKWHKPVFIQRLSNFIKLFLHKHAPIGQP